jgi:hypothetical protein
MNLKKIQELNYAINIKMRSHYFIVMTAQSFYAKRVSPQSIETIILQLLILV